MARDQRKVMRDGLPARFPNDVLRIAVFWALARDRREVPRDGLGARFPKNSLRIYSVRGPCARWREIGTCDARRSMMRDGRGGLFLKESEKFTMFWALAGGGTNPCEVTRDGLGARFPRVSWEFTVTVFWSLAGGGASSARDDARWPGSSLSQGLLRNL